jgi:hypothetical protein
MPAAGGKETRSDMRIEIGLENGYENKSIAWALDYPGCFAYGGDGSDAILSFPRAFIGYKERVQARTGTDWIDFEDFDIHLAETFDCYQVDGRILPAAGGKNVTAFWQVDWKPLSQLEIDRWLQVLDWSRSDLLDLTSNLSNERLDKEVPDEKWGIRGILRHLSSSELWLLDRINSHGGETFTLPEDTFRRLAVTRNLFKTTLHSLVNDTRVVGRDGSIWSPRKVLRRAAWHEVDHINHILRLLNEG